ncbi:MAG TPA: PPOX class F420-dependent oxidoreductase [Acidimicrobiales bacterium]|jgi:PPOX class probable F420-dependent enzyme|nr:PPOX class F420-dependent oxidoreductase [Acidimicrobiales bacterium]
MSLTDRVIELARAKSFPTVTTIGPDGTPHSQPLWVDTDGEHLLINTETGRQKFKNLQRDPRVTVTLLDPENPYSYVEVRGRMVDSVTGPEARDHIDHLSQKYNGTDYGNPIQTERVIVKIDADKTLGR